MAATRVEARQAWLTIVVAALAVIYPVAQQDIDRPYRVVAVTLILLGAASSLIGWWRSAWKGVGIVAALVLVASSIVVVALAPESRDEPAPRLRWGQLLVTDGIEGKEEAFDITIRNLGSGDALLTGLDLTVRDFAYIPICASQGEVVGSGSYRLKMPDNPKAGETVSVPLHQDVKPSEPDRFTVNASAPEDRYVVRDGSRNRVGASYVYLVDLTLHSDLESQPLSLGSALISVPFSPSSAEAQFWDVRDPNRQHRLDYNGSRATEIAKCLDDNSYRLAAILQAKGAVRSEQLGSLTKNGLAAPWQR
jgi:hypothetical protein